MKIQILLTLLVFALLLGVGTSTALAAPRDVCVSNGTGNWNTAGTWSCGHVPSSSDIVIINNGHIVTLDTNGAAYQLIVGGGTSGTLTQDATPRTLSVGAGGVSVSSGGTFNAPSTLTITDGNLTNNGTFNHNSGTVVMAGSSAKSISGSNLTFNDLTISNSAGIDLASNATVNNTLTLNYDLRVGSGYTLTMSTNATTLGDADVVGKVKRNGSFNANTAYTFGSAYTAITFASGGTPPSEITVELFKTAPGGLASPVTRYYSITSQGGNNYTFTLRLHYRDSELAGNTESDLQMWEQVNGRWTLRARTGNNTTDNWVEKSGLTSGLSSFWALDDSGAPTAVNLSTFEARAEAPNALPWVGLGALAVLALGMWWSRR